MAEHVSGVMILTKCCCKRPAALSVITRANLGITILEEEGLITQTQLQINNFTENIMYNVI